MLSAIDEWQFIDVHSVGHELESNESKNECDSVLQVLELVQ